MWPSLDRDGGSVISVYHTLFPPDFLGRCLHEAVPPAVLIKAPGRASPFQAPAPLRKWLLLWERGKGILEGGVLVSPLLLSHVWGCL